MIISCCHLLHTSLGSYLHYCLERSQHNVIYCHTFWISLSTLYLSNCFRVSNYLRCQYNISCVLLYNFFSNVPFVLNSICVLAWVHCVIYGLCYDNSFLTQLLFVRKLSLMYIYRFHGSRMCSATNHILQLINPSRAKFLNNSMCLNIVGLIT